MAVVDAYSPCPCGSGQKFKWCCQKVEAYAERAQRLYENKQIEPALEALREGLRKDPHNAWLLTREAVYELSAGRPSAAMAAVRKVLAKNPKHIGALSLLTRLTLESEGAEAGAAQLQQALSSCPPEARGALTPLVKIVASFLLEAGEFPALIRHLKLSVALDGDSNGAITRAIHGLEAKSTSPSWLRNPDTLSPPPTALAGNPRARFEEALRWAEEGLWMSAAAAFETLSSDHVAGPLAERNLGFCRLWIADSAGAVTALRRYIARIGATTEAVDLEALCQLAEPVHPDDLVERVELSWPLRNREALLAALSAEPTVESEGQIPSDPEDENSPVVDQFALLDKPVLKEASAGLKAADIPRVLGRVLVGQQTVGLVGYDDGRLDALSDRFTALARSAIPSAHPRTKVLEKVARHPLALTWEWLLPEGIDEALSRRLYGEQGQHILNDVWPKTPMGSLRGRTPLQAAQAGDAAVPLRAAVVQLEQARQEWAEDYDFAAFRARLKIDPEPAIDPATVDIPSLHVARLALVPAEALSDDALAALYHRAREFGVEPAIERAGLALTARPEVAEKSGIGTLAVHSDLASITAANGRMAEALDWLNRGRQADAPEARAQNAPYWEMLEVRLKASSTPPEDWVPELAVILERYSGNEAASQLVMLSLIEIGLIDMVPHPEQPGQYLADSRNLAALLAKYGPRVTTASGRLGVSAAKPGIWTPGSDAAQASGGLWTPGSAPASGPPPAKGPSKLIVPGR